MWLTITMPFISTDNGLVFPNPKILETMQPAYKIQFGRNLVSPYAPIVSQGAIMTSESLQLASLTLAAGRSDGAKRMGLTGPACSRPSPTWS